MRNGKRHKNSKSIVLSAPAGTAAVSCGKCKNMTTVKKSGGWAVGCSRGHDDHKHCGAFKDASSDRRLILGGVTGIFSEDR